MFQPQATPLFERHRRNYLGYTIGQSLISSRWIIRQGRTHIGFAPSAFEAVDFVDEIVQAQAIDALLRQGVPLAADSASRRQERYEAINGQNPSPATLAENLARASLAVKRDLAVLRGRRSVDDHAPTAPDSFGLYHGNDTRAVGAAKASFSPDVDSFLNHPSTVALRQEERVLSLKLAEQVSDDPEAFQKAVGTSDEIEAPDSGSGSSLRGKEPSPPLWNALRGIKNTDEILAQKGTIISKIITMALADGEAALSILSKLNSSYPSVTQQDKLMCRAETAAFLIYIANQFVIRFVKPNERAVLMPVVEGHIRQGLKNVGYDQVDFSALLRERHAVYVNYKRWSIEINQEGRPLF